MQLLVLSLVVIECFLLILGWAYPARFSWILAAGAGVAFLASVDFVRFHRARVAAAVCVMLAIAGFVFSWLTWNTSQDFPAVEPCVAQSVIAELSASDRTKSSFGAVVWSWIAGGAMVLTLLETIVIWVGWNASKDTVFQFRRARSE